MRLCHEHLLMRVQPPPPPPPPRLCVAGNLLALPRLCADNAAPVMHPRPQAEKRRLQAKLAAPGDEARKQQETLAQLQAEVRTTACGRYPLRCAALQCTCLRARSTKNALQVGARLLRP